MSEDFLKNPLSLFDVSGKTAIVTGASGAFGALAAKVLAGAGANVVIAAGNAAELEKVAESCKRLGGKIEALVKRPSSETNCEAIVKAAVERFGRLDILVVASGINKVSKIVDQAVADFLEVIDANVTQSWLMARAAGRQMIKQGGGGKIILMSSARGLLGHPAGYSAYCASKSAVDGGLGSLWGTLAGGLVLGVAQAIGAHVNPGWQLLAGHMAFLVILAVRPEGLFPRVRT